MLGSLYIIKNDINNKVYIGKTYQSIEQRFKEHVYEANNINGRKYKIYHAMRKHGTEHFYIELIGMFQEGELEQKEIEYIAKYDSYHNGYNSTLGGDSGPFDDKYRANIIKLSSSKTTTEIANELGISKRNVLRLCKRYGVKSLSMIEAKKHSFRCPSKEELEKVKHLPKTQIAKMFGVSDRTIKNWFDKYGITDGFKQEFDIPPKEELEKMLHMKAEDIGKVYNVSSTTIFKWLQLYELTLETSKFMKEQRKTLPSKEELENISYLTYREIAEIYGVHHVTVIRWFKKYDIDK